MVSYWDIAVHLACDMFSLFSCPNAIGFGVGLSFSLRLLLIIAYFYLCRGILSMALVGEPKSRILQNDKKIAPDFDMAEFLYIGSLKSA